MKQRLLEWKDLLVFGGHVAGAKPVPIAATARRDADAQIFCRCGLGVAVRHGGLSVAEVGVPASRGCGARIRFGSRSVRFDRLQAVLAGSAVLAFPEHVPLLGVALLGT